MNHKSQKKWHQSEQIQDLLLEKPHGFVLILQNKSPNHSGFHFGLSACSKQPMPSQLPKKDTRTEKSILTQPVAGNAVRLQTDHK